MLLKELHIIKEASAKQEVIALAKAGDVEEFIEAFGQAYGSAADIWMIEDRQKELMKMVAAGKKVTTYSTDKYNSDKYEALMAKYKAKGWTLFDDEDNYDSFEAIFVK
jgi:hypothetical protein